jgi:hypothetical protein
VIECMHETAESGKLDICLVHYLAVVSSQFWPGHALGLKTCLVSFSYLIAPLWHGTLYPSVDLHVNTESIRKFVPRNS